MKCIILCAGYGTRLYPLTLNFPKALLSVKEKTILDYIVENVRRIEGVDEIIVISNNKFYDLFSRWKEKFGKDVILVNNKTDSNEEALGGLGDLYLPVNEMKINDDVLVIHGDNLFEDELDGIVDFFNEKKETVIGIYELDYPEGLKRRGVVELKGKKIIGIEEKPEKPKSNLISIGVYLFSKDDVENLGDFLKNKKEKFGPVHFVKHLIENHSVYGYLFKGKAFDIGTKKTFDEVNKIWKSQ